MVASILLYSSKSWVVSPAAMRELEGFHIEDVRRLTGIHPQKVKGKWVYPHSADVLAAAHLQSIVYNIQKRRHSVHNTIKDHNDLKSAGGRRGAAAPHPACFWLGRT